MLMTSMRVALGLILSATVASADDAVDYTKHIKPVLRERCYACHGVLKQEGGLRLDTAALAIKGGDSGPAIVASDLALSHLLQRVSATEESERMPPEGEPLKPTEIAAIRAWIAAGAKAPTDEKPERDPRDHWAFKAPVRLAVPVVSDPVWSRNPIDAFIATKHQEMGLTPQRPADKAVWLRRVTLDLIGLPPTLAEREAFLADDSPEAYDNVVARLLDSPQYGERWGRHWMDIWRYSDWWGLGAEVRNSQKHIWHWRDWIIESLNADKGYDQMVREMLAADELYPNDLDKLRASGFLARQYFKFNRTSWLDETVEHTAKSFLGLTFNCAKCHDHKYDPFAQVEYYQMRAIFEPYQVRTDAVPGEIDFEKDGIPRAFDCNLDAQTFLHIRGDDRNPDKNRVIEPKIPAFLGFKPLQIAPVTLPLEAVQPGLRFFVAEAHVQAAEKRRVEAIAAIAVAAKKLAQSEAACRGPVSAIHDLKLAAVLVPIDQAVLEEKIANQRVTTATAKIAEIRAKQLADLQRLTLADATMSCKAAARAERMSALVQADEALSRAELECLKASAAKKPEAENKLTATKTSLAAAQKAVQSPGDTYTPLVGSLKTLENNLENEESRRKPFPATSTGRRTALAHWLTDPANPLPARVAVNHLWNRHFGRPLVPTVFDFGRKGTPPTHPELLDWLAVELVESGWSMKHLHRLIVTSHTYRMSSSNADVSPETIAKDPDNRFLWRSHPRRMEAQLVRDSLLSLSGELDLTRGGPSIPVKEEASKRRSLYYVHSHNEHQKFLSTFDDANVLECYRRAESIVPQQALALENSPLAATAAEKIAARITVTGEDDFIRAAFQTVLCVDPKAEEIAASKDALVEWTTLAKNANRPAAAQKARAALVQALLNHNDFVTVR